MPTRQNSTNQIQQFEFAFRLSRCRGDSVYCAKCSGCRSFAAKVVAAAHTNASKFDPLLRRRQIIAKLENLRDERRRK